MCIYMCINICMYPSMDFYVWRQLYLLRLHLIPEFSYLIISQGIGLHRECTLGYLAADG